MTATAQGLPGLQKHFKLFIHKRQGIDVGVLTQTLRLARHLVAYFSKQLDSVAQGWPPCLQPVATTCDLLQ